MGLFLLCTITFKAVSKKLQQIASDSNMKNALHFEKILKGSLALLILFFAMFAAFGIGNMVQSNSVADEIYTTFRVPTWLTGK